MIKSRKPNRLKVYDYSLPGYYFITICTNNMQKLFGIVKEGKMILNKNGILVYQNLIKIPKINKEIELDEYVVMPNHIHSIIINNGEVVDAKFASTTVDTDRSKMTLSKVIQQFKRACTIDIKGITPQIDKLWQRSFYDRIIRNEKELYNIRKYIRENPLRWDIEKNIPQNLDLF